MKRTETTIEYARPSGRNKKALPRLSAAAALILSLSFCACSGFGHGTPSGSERPGSSKAGLSDVVINEVVSSCRYSHIDAEVGSADWIELYNAASFTADISGWRLADSPTMAHGFVFPEGTTIEPGGFLTVLCVPDFNGESESSLIAPFGVSHTGEKLYLNNGGTQPSVLEIPALATDVSYARRDGGGYGFSAAPTFGSANSNIVSTLSEATAATEPRDEIELTELVIGAEGWVEIHNKTASPVRLSDYSLTDDPHDPMKWRFPDVSLVSDGYGVVELNDQHPESELSATFKVSRTEGAIYLFDAMRNEVGRIEADTAMPKGVSAVMTAEGVAYTAYPTKGEANSPITFAAIEWKEMDISDPSTRLYINEVLPQNKYGIVDSYGDRSDWVELLNPSDYPAYLSDYYLSDDANDLLKWQLPNVALLPHSYTVIFLSGKESVDGEIHAPFKLSKADGGIYLTRLDGLLTDHIEIPENLSKNISIGRNGQNQIRYYAAPTPGGPNNSYGLEHSADAGGFDARSVYISEVSAVAPARSGVRDWVELYNGSSSSVSLDGWSLTDDPDEPRKFKLDGLKLASGGYAVITCSDKAGSYYHAPFSISNAGDTLYLVNSYGAVCDVFDTGMTTVGVTSGRANMSQTGERCFFTTATKGYQNSSPISGYVAEPEFSRRDLYQSSAFSLELTCATPGAEIRYTLDGSVPTKSSSLYEGKIKISSNAVVRAKAFMDGLIASPVATHTYVFRSAHTMPVVCLSMSKSDYSRMYVGKANPNGGSTKGDEVGCFMEYFIDGRLAISSGAGVRVSGAGTAVYPQKSLGLYFRAGYGRSSLDFPLFDGSSVTSFRSLVLRNGGQDAYYAHVRDTFVSRISRGFNVDAALGRPVIVYINGEYRGVYDMKENLNEDFLVSHDGVSRNKVEIIQRNNRALAGSDANFLEVRRLCRELDLSVQSNFDRVAELVDVDSFIDYLIIRTYFFDGDMFNQKYWHTTDNKIKWRAIVYDSDFAMFGNSPSGNLLYAYFNPNGVSSAHGYITNMDIYCGLNKNKKWREEFIIRYIMAAEKTFDPSRVLPVFDSIVESYKPEMKDQIAKWKMPASYSKWESEVSALRACIKKRPSYALSNLKRFYGLSDSQFAEYERIAKQRMGG